MLRIGLTGGIGCGKSSASQIFRKLGVPIIDSDIIARDLVEPGSATLQDIVSYFGAQAIQPDGNLDRAYMRDLVFRDEGKRAQLEALLHPLIRQEIQRQVDALDTPYVVIAIPLLLEKGWQKELDRVLVIDCSEAQQVERAGRRDGSSTETIERIIASQIGREARLTAADDVLDNSGSLESLTSQVEALHQHYLQLAANN